MTDRAAVVTKIRETIVRLTGVEDIPATALLSMHKVDSLEIAQLAIDLEDDLDLFGALEPADGWTIDIIADAVMAAKQSEKA